jgi:hypothetical protein
MVFALKRLLHVYLSFVQYRVFAVVINGVGMVFKVCTAIEETLNEFEIYCGNILASVFIAVQCECCATSLQT